MVRALARTKEKVQRRNNFHRKNDAPASLTIVFRVCNSLTSDMLKLVLFGKVV